MVLVKRGSNDKPWVTDKFRQMISNRQKAFTNGDKVSFNKLRNAINRTSKTLRKFFYKNSVQDIDESNTSKWWRKAKVITGIKSKENLSYLSYTVYNGNIKMLCNDINSFFQSVSSNLNPLDKEMSHAEFPSKYIISVEEVEKELCKIKLNKSIGPDDIPNWILRDLAPLLSAPIASIFNASLKEGYIPPIWRSANITPLPKVPIVQTIENDLRPISLTPILIKILESFVVSWLWDIVKDKLKKNQFGGIKNSSTSHALTKILHDWHTTIHNHHAVCVLFLDYKKAFDLVDHSILIQKIKKLDVPDVLVNWLGAFLSDRKIRVKLSGEVSDWLSINGSVPQGSKLGPLLYIIMIDDLEVNTENTDLYKFMDDTTASEIITHNSPSNLQTTADQVLEWTIVNNAQVNPSKTVEMLISFAKDPPELERISIGSNEISRVDQYKLLGLIISNDLTWTAHVDTICKKANKRLFYLILLRRSGVAKSDLVKFYKHIIRPILEYGCAVWHSSLPNFLVDKLENVQVRAMNIIGPEAERLETLKSRREEMCVRFFKNMTKETHVLDELLPKSKDASQHMATRNFVPYHLPKCNTNRFKNSFVPFSLLHRQEIFN